LRRSTGAIGALLAAALLAVPAGARAAVVLETFRQGSASNTDLLDTTGVTVGTGANRLLVIGVSLADAALTVREISWKGVAATRVFAQNLSGAPGDCRTELWRIVDPPSGFAQLHVALSGPTAFGVGIAAYTGVDQQSPTSAPVTTRGSTSAVTISVATVDTRPVVALACLGGSWPVGPGPTTPDAIVGPGDTGLWDFTEPGVVGLGSQQVGRSGGSTGVSWMVSFAGSFVWGALAVTLTPAGLPPPPDAGADAGADAAVDARPAEDLAPPFDAAVDGAAPDAAEDAPPPLDAAESDAAAADDAADDAGFTARDVNLRVGCACALEGAGRERERERERERASWPLAAAALVLLFRSWRGWARRRAGRG
jgi:hypothetical protein